MKNFSNSEIIKELENRLNNKMSVDDIELFLDYRNEDLCLISKRKDHKFEQIEIRFFSDEGKPRAIYATDGYTNFKWVDLATP